MLLMGGAGVWLRSGVLAAPGTSSHSGFAVLLGADRRRQLLRLAGALIILLGLITFARGVVPMSAHLHGI
jgi:hypothetical protein